MVKFTLRLCGLRPWSPFVGARVEILINNMSLESSQSYRLTSEILCVGPEGSSGGPFYLPAGTVVTVFDLGSCPLIQVIHSTGIVRLFAEDLLNRSALVNESNHNVAAA
jgi:hypothetical protein